MIEVKSRVLFQQIGETANQNWRKCYEGFLEDVTIKLIFEG